MDNAVHLGRRTLLKAVAGGVAAVATSGLVAACAGAPTPAPGATAAGAPTGQGGPLELYRSMRTPSTPTGVAVSRGGRVFVCMPRYDRSLPFSVGEVGADGSVTPYPDPVTSGLDTTRPRETFFDVPNGVVDRQERLWLLDAGLVDPAQPPTPEAAKLVCVDLSTDRVVRTVPLGAAVVPEASLNDLRIAHGPDGQPRYVYLTDQGRSGQGALVAVDLSTGRTTRRLADHPTTGSLPGGTLRLIEGVQVQRRSADGAVRPVLGGANAIALSPDARRLYYAPLAGHDLYSVDTAVLLDASADDTAVAATIVDLGDKGPIAGMAADADDRIYLSLHELNGVGRRDPDGTIRVLATDPRLVWPDTFSITDDGWLYVTSAQANRRPEFNGGVDRQQPPYALMRMRIDVGPA